MIDLIPKQTFAYPRKTTLFFYGTLVFVAATLAGFLVLQVLQSNASAAIVGLQDELSRQKTSQELLLERKVLGYEQTLKDFSSLERARVSPLEFFEFLEANTHPAVFFTSFTLVSKDQKLTLSGEALDFKSLDQQLALFQQHEKVAVAQVSGIGIGERGRVTFQFTLEFKE